MLRVMLVDDEKNVLLGLERLIDWAACDADICGTFTDPAEALVQAKSLKPDLIISDIEMPGMTGLELIASLSEVSPASVFVILSAYDDFQYAKQSVALGVFRYLVKPLPAEDLTALLSDVKKKIETAKPEDETRKMIRSLVLQDMIIQGSSLRLSDSLSYYGDLDSTGPFVLLSLQFAPMAKNMFRDDSELMQLLDDLKPLVIFRKNDEILLLLNNCENNGKILEIEKKIRSLCTLKVSDLFFRIRDSHIAWLSLCGPAASEFREPENQETNEPSAQGQEQLVRKAMDCIEDHYSDPDFKLSDVADLLFVNNSYLSHLFRTQTGKTMFSCLLDTRMSHASLLLKHSVYSVDEIARMVGYPSSKNFHAAFLKYFGKSPKSYRKSML